MEDFLGNLKLNFLFAQISFTNALLHHHWLSPYKKSWIFIILVIFFTYNIYVFWNKFFLYIFWNNFFLIKAIRGEILKYFDMNSEFFFTSGQIFISVHLAASKFKYLKIKWLIFLIDISNRFTYCLKVAILKLQ